jgi:hypothetical protein
VVLRCDGPAGMPFRTLAAAALVLALGCGDGGGSSAANGEQARVTTLAYVLSECREGGDGFSAHQQLRLQRADGSEVTVGEDGVEGLPNLGLCARLGLGRNGRASVLAGSFQRLGVSRDGAQAAFEVTREFSILGVARLPPEQEGFFAVRSDGTGLRRIAPPSRYRAFSFAVDPNAPAGIRATFADPIAFSPNGERIAYGDLGPGPGGEEAVQVFTVHLRTGERTQLTSLPPVVSDDPLRRDIAGLVFVDDRRLAFVTLADPEGMNPGGGGRVFTVDVDGSNLRAAPESELIPGSQFDPEFQIVGDRASTVRLFSQGVNEIYLVDGNSLLQLSNFGLPDTANPLLTADGSRVLFTGSADPLGLNPFRNCQVFSLDATGAGLRQITSFDPGAPSPNGCAAPDVPPGCGIDTVNQDTKTGAVLFKSSCDPFGTNPNGSQIFAIRPDGTGLRQLTQTAGMLQGEDGSAYVEIPGPLAASAVRR